MIDLKQLSATVDSHLAARRPFAIYALPGAAGAVAAQGSEFVLTPWRASLAEAVSIDSSGTAPAVWSRTTPTEEYFEMVRTAGAAHTPRQGKTVISRTVCGTASATAGEAAAEIFARFPHTLRYVCWSPATGGWLGATPEVLASVKGHELHTMALAGTREATNDSAPWDEKNRREHRMVVDFIADTLRSKHCEAVHTHPAESLRYGEICHLCTPIDALLCPETSTENVINALNPTPAVAGSPRAEALHAIEALEAHPRRFYAGLVGIRGAEGCADYFVNLRCANFDASTGRVCIYAGGGITALSDPEAEWLETAHKAGALIKAFRL